MTDGTKIEWTQIPGYRGETWNPMAGCSIASPGCKNCYAMRQAPRLAALDATPHYHGTVQPSNGGPVWTGRVNLAGRHVLERPLRWRKPRAVFVNSMSDLFHEDVPDAWIDQVFAIMALCPQHVFMVLTKRAERMRDYMRSYVAGDRWIIGAVERIKPNLTLGQVFGVVGSKPAGSDHLYPLPNVWLGVSVEDQTRADERIPPLLATPAAVRFVSAEPLLGAVDLTWIAPSTATPLLRPVDLTWMAPSTLKNTRLNALIGEASWRDHTCAWTGPGLDWVIAGGESGHGARPMDPEWAREMRDQCEDAGVPFFMKQMAKKAEIPEDLRVREWPEVITG